MLDFLTYGSQMQETVPCGHEIMLPKPPGTVSMQPIIKRAPRRVYEGKFGTAVRDVQKYFNLIADCVRNMRKLCPIPEADFFFDEFKSYEKTVTSVIQDASKIIRKVTQSYSEAAQGEPAYEVSERFLQSHSNFDVALSHLKVRKPSIFANTLRVLSDQLEACFDRYVMKSSSAKSAQFGIIMNQCESQFRQEFFNCRKSLKALTDTVAFDHMQEQDAIDLSERYKRLNRMFEAELYVALRSFEPSLPDVTKTEWHRTFIQFIPLLTNAPEFNEQLKIINTNMPFLTDAIEKFCSRLNVTSPMFKEITMFRNNTREGALQRMEDMIMKATTFLGITTDTRNKSKVEQLEDVVDQAEVTVANLRKEIEEKDTHIEELKQEVEKARSQGIRNRLAAIRAETNKIAERQRMSVTVYLNSMIAHLKTLITGDFSSEDEDPMRRFNSLFLQLSREMNALRRQNSQMYCDFDNKHPEIRNKLVQICKNMDSEWSDKDQSLDAIVDHISDLSKKDPTAGMVNDICSLIGTADKATYDDLKKAVKALKDENEEMKQTLTTVCSKTSDKSEEHFRAKSVTRLCHAARKHVNKSLGKAGGITKGQLDEIKPGLSSSQDCVQTIKDEFNRTEYTSTTIEPITKLIIELNSMLEPSFKKYLPTSPEFSHYLDLVSAMKDVLHRINPNNVIRPVHALVVQAVELFNSLTIALSSASFAPEYSENQQAIADILSKYQDAVQSVQRLRVLLEEKDSLLSKETQKLMGLENEQTGSSSYFTDSDSSAF